MYLTFWTLGFLIQFVWVFLLVLICLHLIIYKIVTHYNLRLSWACCWTRRTGKRNWIRAIHSFFFFAPRSEIWLPAEQGGLPTRWLQESKPEQLLSLERFHLLHSTTLRSVLGVFHTTDILLFISRELTQLFNSFSQPACYKVINANRKMYCSVAEQWACQVCHVKTCSINGKEIFLFLASFLCRKMNWARVSLH